MSKIIEMSATVRPVKMQAAKATIPLWSAEPIQDDFYYSDQDSVAPGHQVALTVEEVVAASK
jgi:hypothetical protein